MSVWLMGWSNEVLVITRSCWSISVWICKLVNWKMLARKREKMQRKKVLAREHGKVLARKRDKVLARELDRARAASFRLLCFCHCCCGSERRIESSPLCLQRPGVDNIVPLIAEQ